MRKIERFNNKPTQLVPVVDNTAVISEIAKLKAEMQAARQQPAPRPHRETQQTSFPTDFVDRLDHMDERLAAVEAAVQQYADVAAELFKAFELLKDMHENHTHEAEILKESA